MKLHYALAADIKQAARFAAPPLPNADRRRVVIAANRFMRGLATDTDRATLAAAAWKLLGKEVVRGT
jgi:hypothetical protein